MFTRAYFPGSYFDPLYFPGGRKQPAPFPMGVRVDLYEADGTTKVAAGPVLTVLDWMYREHVNQVGNFSFSVPLDHPIAEELNIEDHPNRIAQIHIGGEGFVFQGRVEKVV